MDDEGREVARHRIATPRHDYEGTIAAMVGLVQKLEAEIGETATVGAGIPGSERAATGLIKNANSTWLNGRPLKQDLSAAMGREVRLANDANCLAVSEATDGAARGQGMVFAVILGTGCGGGVALRGPGGVQVHAGPNGVGGEWGHNPLPWPTAEELPGPPCYCGKNGCLEMWLSGTGIAYDHAQVTGAHVTTREIATRWSEGEAAATATMQRFEQRLARALASVVNVLDPDIFVVGGGVSRITRIYDDLPEMVRPWVFGGDFDTPIVPATFGDSSGVRGAAWLWPRRG